MGAFLPVCFFVIRFAVFQPLLIVLKLFQSLLHGGLFFLELYKLRARLIHGNNTPLIVVWVKEIGNKYGSSEPCLFPIWARIAIRGPHKTCFVGKRRSKGVNAVFAARWKRS